ncbi:MAG: DUF1707 domain-containing protein [Acidimicrobiales bacterium]
MQSAYGTGSASDAVRAYCEARLRSAVANGTITWEDFERRLDATYSVDTLAELDELVRSLPDLPDIPAKAISPRRKNGVGAAVIAATLCGAMLLVFLVVHSSPKSPSVSVPTTASEARSARRGPTRARPPTVPTSAAKGAGLPGARAKATGWRVGWAYQALPKGFTVISGGSSDNPISCTPGTTFCVAVVSAPTATMNGFVPLGDVVTTDGRTWTGYRGIPSVFAVVNGISCPTTSTCMIVGDGQPRDGPEIAVSDDGGKSWALLAPPPLSSVWLFNSVDCVSASTCWVAGANSANPETPLVMESTDGGQRWAVFSNLPALEQAVLADISCASTTTCVAVGTTTDADPEPAAAVVLRTDDAGQHWSAPTSTVLRSSNGLSGVSCPDTAHCFAVGGVQGGGSIVLRTSDGGATWAGHALSADNGWLNSVDCPTPADCWAVGTATTLALVGTANAGALWTDVPDDHTTTSGGTVSCPTVDRCWATQENGLWATSNDGDLEQAVVAVLTPRGVSVPLVNAGPGKVDILVENTGHSSVDLEVRAASGKLVSSATVPRGGSELTLVLRPGAYWIVVPGPGSARFVVPRSLPKAATTPAPLTTPVYNGTADYDRSDNEPVHQRRCRDDEDLPSQCRHHDHQRCAPGVHRHSDQPVLWRRGVGPALWRSHRRHRAGELQPVWHVVPGAMAVVRPERRYLFRCQWLARRRTDGRGHRPGRGR